LQTNRRAVWQIDTKVRQKPVRSMYRLEECVIILNTETADSSQREVPLTCYKILHPKLP